MFEKQKEVHLLGVLREARSVHKQRMQPFLRELDLTEDQWRVLKVLNKAAERSDAGLDAKSITQQSGIVAPSLSGVLSRMERDGLLTRTKSDSDGRFMVIKSTMLGEEKLHLFANVVQKYYASLEKSLGEQKMLMLYQLLDELIALGNNPSVEMRSALQHSGGVVA